MESSLRLQIEADAAGEGGAAAELPLHPAALDAKEELAPRPTHATLRRPIRNLIAHRDQAARVEDTPLNCRGIPVQPQLTGGIAPVARVVPVVPERGAPIEIVQELRLAVVHR